MKVLHISIERFRGFDDVEVVPRGHVLLVGEPRAGRSDLLSALNLVLDPDAVRGVSELDFHNLETNDAVIKTIIGDLGSDLEQRFLDQLEFWDPEDQGLVEDAEDPSDLARVSWLFGVGRRFLLCGGGLRVSGCITHVGWLG